MSAVQQLQRLLTEHWFDPADERDQEHAEELWQVALNDYRQARTEAPIES